MIVEERKMKKLVLGAALVALFGSAVVEVEASRSTVKTVFGYNNKETKTAFASYPNAATDATTLRGQLKAMYSQLENFAKQNQGYQTTINNFLGALKKCDIALESLEHMRKLDDIVPDFSEACQVLAGLQPLYGVIGATSFLSITSAAPLSIPTLPATAAAQVAALQALANVQMFYRSLANALQVPTFANASAGATSATQQLEQQQALQQQLLDRTSGFQEQLNKLALLEQRVVAVEQALTANQTFASAQAAIAWATTHVNTLNDVQQQATITASTDTTVNSKKAEITNRVTPLLTRLRAQPKTRQEPVLDLRTGGVALYSTVYYY
jgi:hypothetical protein